MITYLLIFILKMTDCLLTTLKTKAMIYGHDRLSNFIKAIGAIVYMMVISKVLIDKSFVAILIVGLAEYIGGEIGVFIFKVFQDKFKQDKPYQFTIKFRTLEMCEIIKNQLEQYKIKVYINKNNKTLKAFSLTREDSKIIKDTIENKFKNYTVNEFKEYIKA